MVRVVFLAPNTHVDVMEEHKTVQLVHLRAGIKIQMEALYLGPLFISQIPIIVRGVELLRR